MRDLPEFDVLVDMARTDPTALERLRTRLTNAVIDAQADPLKKQRLKGLAFQIDMERQRARTPMAATIKLSEMMCWKLAELNRCFLQPEEVTAEQADVPETSGKVIPMRRPPH
ncbi:MAG: DUF3135 domain-containing protein [Pseudomonadales bacterium]|nr:DUF3135 domain-containing protein [Pseudomonadales bacterium]MCP5182768.1 DUF3135 domain-containing protein [Pseudomonadales bacterium]